MENAPDTRNQRRGVIGTSSLAKGSMLINGRSTSVALEQPFWSALQEIAASQGMPVATLVSTIDSERRCANLTSSIRVFVLERYRNRAGRARPDCDSWWREPSKAPEAAE